jgi:ubiquinone/menaquinone biosynthesis C-methylase UbiE
MVRLPFEDASVDLVVGCAILPPPARIPVAFLPEVRRVLKPGAPCVFIGDPSTWGSRISNLMKLPLLVVYRTYKVSLDARRRRAGSTTTSTCTRSRGATWVR